MASNPPKATIPCSQCDFVNEAERVYCHNCGAKLDRTLLPKELERTQETPEKARKRVAKMTNPNPNPIGRELKTLLKVAICSAIAAALILMAQPPDGLPPSKREIAERMVMSELMDAVNAPTARALAFTDDEINRQLRQSLKQSEGTIPGVKFERAYVKLSEGAVLVGIEQSLWGFPFVSTEVYQIGVGKDGKFAATLLGGKFGRLPIDPRVLKYVDFHFQRLWETLKHQHEQMNRMQLVQAHPGRIDFVTKPNSR